MRTARISDPRQWSRAFNISNIAHNVEFFAPYPLNGFLMRKKDGKYVAFPLETKSFDQQAVSGVKEIDRSMVEAVMTLNAITSSSLRTLLFHMHLDLIFPVSAAAADKADMEQGSQSRSTIFEPTKKGVTFTLTETTGQAASRRANAEIRPIFERSGLASLELPHDYDSRKTVSAITAIADFLDEVKANPAVRLFHLRFRRLGNYKANGFYSKETATIIVDPRNVDVFVHELGHHIQDNALDLAADIQDAHRDPEDFAQAFTHRYGPTFARIVADQHP